MATPPTGFSLRRWSQRKREATRPPAEDRGVPASGAAAAIGQDSPAAGAEMAPARGAAIQAPAASPPPAAGDPLELRPVVAASPLPPVESLTADSDFAAFMRPEVDDVLKRGALKKLFSDPRFNVMDGLDIYIDDYSKPDPLDPMIARALVQALRVVDEPGPATESPPMASPPPAVPDAPQGPGAGGDAPGTVAESKAQPAPAGASDDPPGTPR